MTSGSTGLRDADRPRGRGRARAARAASAFGHAVLAAALLLLACAGARAETAFGVDQALGKVGGWSLGFSTAMDGCLALGTFKDRTTVWLGVGSAPDHAFFALSNPNWRALEPGGKYELELRVGAQGRWRGGFTGMEVMGDKGLLAQGLKDQFLVDIARAATLEVFYQDKSIAQLSLSGSLAAVNAAAACQKERAGGDRQAARAPAEAGRPGAAKPGEIRPGEIRPGETRPGAARPEAAEPRKKAEGSSFGTGFYVSERGHILTNHHVVESCSAVTVTRIGALPEPAQVLARDATNDLALLKVDAAQKEVPPLAPRVRIGDSIFVYGFPLAGILASTGNFTIGNVTATAGLADDTRMVQISAPVQPGNSGGPLLDQYGNVVGIVVSKLNALQLAAVTNDVAQNVNFAIKSSVASNFLDVNGISVSPAVKAVPLDPATLAEQAKAFTVRIECK